MKPAFLSALLAGCAELAAPVLARVFSQNAGTTPYLDVLGESDLRETCETWYDNNLCTLDAEALLADAIAAAEPDVVLLQEAWDQARCAEPDRPAEADTEPFACAGGGSQPERLLPAGYGWACAVEYPDNCIAWREDVVTADADALTDLESGCEPAGRIATLDARLGEQALLVAVLHTSAGYGASDQACRISQLSALQEALLALPTETAVLIGGDVNHDPGSGSPEAEVFTEMLEQAGLSRLEDDGDTARLLGIDLDAVAARGVLAEARCAVRQLDEGWAEPMFDHALLDCQ